MSLNDDFDFPFWHVAETAEPQEPVSRGLFRVMRSAYIPDTGKFAAPVVPDEYRTISNLNDLMIEGAKNDASTMREGLAAVAAMRAGAIQGPLHRGPFGGIDFYDSNGVPFDVKTGAPGYPMYKLAKSVLHELSVGQMGSDSQNYHSRVVLDTTFLNRAEHDFLWILLSKHINNTKLIEVTLPYSPEARIVRIR